MGSLFLIRPGQMPVMLGIPMLLLLLVAVSCSNMSSGEKGALAGAGIGAAGGVAELLGGDVHGSPSGSRLEIAR